MINLFMIEEEVVYLVKPANTSTTIAASWRPVAAYDDCSRAESVMAGLKDNHPEKGYRIVEIKYYPNNEKN